MVAVRRLGSGDVAGFRAMNAVFSDVFGEPHNYADKKPGEAYCEAWLADPRNIAIIAESDGETVGALAGYEWVKFEQERSELYIYDLAVAETHRRQGIATAMIEEVRNFARAVGAWSVIVQADVLPEDEPARALYRKLAREEIMAHHFDIEP